MLLMKQRAQDGKVDPSDSYGTSYLTAAPDSLSIRNKLAAAKSYKALKVTGQGSSVSLS